MSEQHLRLDSWKEIAEYLDRDVRTAMRWAKSHGLPVRRVGGDGGRSVFAFTTEIDAWLASQPARARPTAPVPPDAPLDGMPMPASGLAGRMPVRKLIAAAMAGVLLVGGAAALRGRLAVRPPSHAVIRDGAVIAVDGAGVERVIYTFPSPHQMISTNAPPAIADVDADGRADITLGVSHYVDQRRRAAVGGEMLNVSADGEVRWRFAFDDRLAFQQARFEGPWGLTDWQIEPAPGRARLAVSAHDLTWWPSVLAVLDHTGKRLGTFVHPGWVESVMWLPGGRIALGGFNNLRDEAVFALIDADRVDGQAPGSAGTPFACQACPGAAPLFYATFARSEINRVTASRFNRAQVASRGETILVTTAETGPEHGEVNALYEFNRDFAVVSARYSDRYWDEHHRLELEGRLNHARAACPERDGPAAIRVWTRGGWQRVPVPR